MPSRRRRGKVRVRMPAPSIVAARVYERQIRKIRTDALVLIDELVIPELARIEALRGDERADDVTSGIREGLAALSARLAARWSDQRIRSIVETIGDHVDRGHKREFYRRLGSAVGVEVVASEGFRGRIMDDFVRSNVALMKSVQGSLTVALGQDIEAAFAAGIRHEDLRRRWVREGLPVRFGTLEGRARVIARDQVSKLNGQLTEWRQRNLGITEYVWRTSGDARVRDSHADLNGTRRSWDQSPKPGEEVQCRCVAEAVIDIDAMEASAAAAVFSRPLPPPPLPIAASPGA